MNESSELPSERTEHPDINSLEDALQTYRSIFEHIDAGILLLRNDNTIFGANPTACSILGYTHDELTSMTVMDLHPAGEHERVNELKQQAMATGNFHNVEGMHYIHKEGYPVPVEISATIVRLTAEAMAVVHFRDITWRTADQRQREALMQELAARHEELQSIVFIASHDLKTPLVNILGFSGELVKRCNEVKDLIESAGFPADWRQKLAPLMYEDIPEALHFITAGGSRIQTLLDGLLAVSRAGSATLDVEPLDMDEIVRGVIASMQYQISRSKVVITVDKLPPCQGDNEYISQVFGNLIANAVKYAAPGRQGRIVISGRVTDGRAVYSVEDNGCGIAPEHRERIFDMFYRIGDDTEIKGEGLGLTIAKRIIERHEGTLTLESQPGEGTTFFIALPAG
jgi:PAS domain S-box-containing protein